MRALPPVVQARRDSNPQPPVLETGALPVELRTPAHTPGHPPAGEPVDGQGRNRTADTAIFSRVLYQLSYLAKKNARTFSVRAAGSGVCRGLPASPASPPARARPRIGRKPAKRPRAARPLEGPRPTDFGRFRHDLRLGLLCCCLRQTVLLRGKRRHSAALSSSGGGIRTRDLRVMSPTSYQTAPPRNKKRKVKQSREACQAEVGRKRRASTGPSAPWCQARILTPPRCPRKRPGGSA